MVRYIGHLDGRSQSTHDQYIGIEIRVTDGALGDSNGTFNNKTYFRCAPNSGLFIEPQQILQIYSPEVGVLSFNESVESIEFHHILPMDSLTDFLVSSVLRICWK